MPRTAILKPARRDTRAAKGLAAWAVNVPPELSPTGKRQELFFPTRGEAAIECEKLKARKDNFGISLATMTPQRIAEASEAYKLLDQHEVGLLDCVRDYVAILAQRKSSVSLGEAFSAFAELKQSKSPKYRQEIRHVKAKFEALLDRLVCDVQPADLEGILSTMPASSRNAAMRRLRSVFNLAIKREWMLDGKSPVAKLDFADTARDEVAILSVDEVQRLLDHALAHDLEFLPYRVFTLFCGIRPEGELSRLKWSDVNLAGKEIVLPAAITKTKRKRAVKLSDNALAWLGEYQARGGNMTGLVVPWSKQILRTKHRTSYRAAGIKRWIQQGARHSFCSYWLTHHKSIDGLILQTGHDDAKIMWQRYYGFVTETDAAKFWAIAPPPKEGKIIHFQAAS
jgi:integrase